MNVAVVAVVELSAWRGVLQLAVTMKRKAAAGAEGTEGAAARQRPRPMLR